jgi:predicted GTPase
MVQAADLWKGDNSASRGWLYGPRLRTILAEREMRSASVVILKVGRQHSAQVTLVEDDDVIDMETLTPRLAREQRMRLRFMTQIKTRPPTSMLSVSRPQEVSEGYLRFLINRA